MKKKNEITKRWFKLTSLFFILVFAFGFILGSNALAQVAAPILPAPIDAYVAYIENPSSSYAYLKLTGLRINSSNQKQIIVDQLTSHQAFFEMKTGKNVSLAYVDVNFFGFVKDVKVADVDRKTLKILAKEKVPFRINSTIAQAKGMDMEIGLVNGQESKVVVFAFDNTIQLAQKIGNNWKVGTIYTSPSHELFSDLGLDLVTQNGSIVGVKVIARIRIDKSYVRMYEIMVNLKGKYWSVSKPKQILQSKDSFFSNYLLPNMVSMENEKLAYSVVSSDNSDPEVFFSIFQAPYGWSTPLKIGKSFQCEVLGGVPFSTILAKDVSTRKEKLKLYRAYGGNRFINTYEVYKDQWDTILDFAIHSKYRKSSSGEDYYFFVIPISTGIPFVGGKFEVVVIENDVVSKIIPIPYNTFVSDVEVELAD